MLFCAWFVLSQPCLRLGLYIGGDPGFTQICNVMIMMAKKAKVRLSQSKSFYLNYCFFLIFFDTVIKNIGMDIKKGCSYYFIRIFAFKIYHHFSKVKQWFWNGTLFHLMTCNAICCCKDFLFLLKKGFPKCLVKFTKVLVRV